MLPLLHCQRYREFQQALELLHQASTVNDLEVSALRDNFQKVQQLFDSKIASLNADDVAPHYASRWQSVQTEIHKQMRLLATDVMLLISARSSATFQRRVSSVRDRINTLIQYCEALLQL